MFESSLAQSLDKVRELYADIKRKNELLREAMKIMQPLSTWQWNFDTEIHDKAVWWLERAKREVDDA